jgi:hypothetical protein
MNSTIGTLIMQHCKKNNIAIATLATHLKIKRESLYRSFHSGNMKLSRLTSISQILNHNFFEDYYPSALNPGDNPSPLLSENLQLKEKISRLETELAAYRDIIALLKSSVSNPKS